MATALISTAGPIMLPIRTRAQPLPLAPQFTAAPAPAPPAATANSTHLADLPTELHLHIFAQLDAIDATCLGLASRQMYATYRRAQPARVPLSQRRTGPNLLESAWEVLGATGCQFCGIYRCELHAHIRGFVPDVYEYCTVRQVYGLKAEGGREHCFRSCPPQPRRCGRHVLPKGEEEEEVVVVMTKEVAKL